MPEIAGVGVLTAFLAGAVSFLSPCVLPLVPGYLSYVAGRSVGELQEAAPLHRRLPALGLSLCFVFGFSTVFLILGASASAMSQLLLSYRYEANIIGGSIIVVFGLFMTGLLRLGWLQREFRFGGTMKGGRPLGSYLLGVAFGFGWTPCIGPVLGAILTVTAMTTQASGITLLAVYSLGLGLPFLLAAVFTAHFINHMKTMRRFGRPLQVAAGVIMIILGVAMITGYLSVFAFWMLNTFPILGRIG
ncbi:MAG: cytochrome c biogenesis protein CcdA [Gammaproteobacteria bacterium]|nr:cytochrome c biogenesis protein CcdA [Gammaproteobacteria bacterium]MDH3407640.1 cytochrome c biogenesis protein CcdA [Gammaproteobacteria bacterium]